MKSFWLILAFAVPAHGFALNLPTSKKMDCRIFASTKFEPTCACSPQFPIELKANMPETVLYEAESLKARLTVAEHSLDPLIQDWIFNLYFCPTGDCSNKLMISLSGNYQLGSGRDFDQVFFNVEEARQLSSGQIGASEWEYFVACLDSTVYGGEINCSSECARRMRRLKK